MTASEGPRISAAELAELAGTSGDRLAQLIDAGLLAAAIDGHFSRSDAHRVRIIDAFIEAGIPVQALVEATERDVISFAYYDRLHPQLGALSRRRYGEIKAELGDRAATLSRLVTALGLAEPDPDTRLTVKDEDLLLQLLDIVEATGTPDLALRVARLFGDGTRRTMDAVLTVYGEAVGQLIGHVPGVPSREVNEAFLAPWNRYAQIAPTLGRWLTERHLSNAIDAFSVTTSEEFLAAAGFVAPRVETPPAIAFVDISGFTRYAVERGDELAARLALEFGQLAENHARATGGRLVKLLGDGALLRFDSVADAADATLRLLAELPRAGLPTGHAGIDAGPIIVRDGDVFGRTVNRASRIADVAEAGSVLLPADVASGLPPSRFSVARAGTSALPGIPDPVALVRAELRQS